MAISSSFEVLRQFRYLAIVATDDGPKKIRACRVFSDPFVPETLWLATGSQKLDGEGSIAMSAPEVVEALHASMGVGPAVVVVAPSERAPSIRRGRMKVAFLSRANALGRVFDVSFANIEEYPFDLASNVDGYAMEWVRLVGVVYGHARAATKEDEIDFGFKVAPSSVVREEL